MFRAIERYQTADGKQHATQQEASDHIADKCRETLDEKLKPLMDAGQMSASERYRVIMALVPDAPSAWALIKNIENHFLWDEYDE